MTREEIGDLPPGREFDVLIARTHGLNIVALDWPCGRSPDCGQYAAAMHPNDYHEYHLNERGPVYLPEHGVWPPESDELGGEPFASVLPVPFYSTDDAAAMQLLADLEAEGYHTQLRFDPLEQPDWRHSCVLRPPAPTSSGRMGVSVEGFGGHGPGRALAVSRAVLRALTREAAVVASTT
jgi:hypothetical protein